MIRIALLLDFTEEYHKKLLRGITRYSREHGRWAFLRIPVYYRETLGVDGLVRWAKEWGAKGLIGQLHAGTQTTKFHRAGISVIAQDYEERFRDVPNISGSYRQTGTMAADYFLAKGFRHFAFYGFGNFVWSRERSEGFEKRIHEAGYDVYYFEHKRSRSMDLWYYKPSNLSRWLKSLPKPLALMACDDNQALHISEACKHAGLRIPEDVSILGVDNDENVCFLSDPPLSSIEVDIEQGGYEAAALMEKMINGKSKKHADIIVHPKRIVSRSSTEIFSTADVHVNQALKFIHANGDKNLNVEDVLKQVPLSRRSLEKRFRKEMGVPVYKYIFRMRMQRFDDMLRNTDLTITEIANELGLGDTKNISRQFKEWKGASPAEMRNLSSFTIGH